ncbi:MAG: hypothetical protein CMJ78_02840 [Planctomycetaceae bacterium]|nr:hypothetical protein [Planctomycetaceae bacterium]
MSSESTTWGDSSSWSWRHSTASTPSWIISVAVHGTLLFLMATTFRSCGGTIPSAGESEFRDVGIYLKDNNAVAENQLTDSNTSESNSANPVNNVVAEAAPDEPKDTSLETLLDVPEIETPTLGAGAPQTYAVQEVGSLVDADTGKIRQSTNASRASALAPGETSFFNIKDKGQRFVYVLDRSGSMSNHGAIRVAKAELVNSLGGLDATQQFQVIFYSNTHTAFQQGDARKMYWATDINRTMARQFISGVRTDGGTNHLPALKKALSFEPDVIYFLTDADEPQLTAKELDNITRANRGGTRLHCIEFGSGPKLKVNVENFLEKLARFNDGTYHYRDVTKFGSR